MKPNVIDEIVKNNLCIGCGTCAGVCPQEILKIQDNEYGEYIPYETQMCDSGCGLCLEVCPFGNNENETQMGAKIYGSTQGMKYLSETGYYLDSYAGYSSEFRQSSASGGMAAWLLTKLLKEGIVDYVICPTSQKNPEKLFSFEIMSDENSVKAASGSVYYPVEMSEVIHKILEVPGHYAVTGLPCFVKALRLAAQKNRKLRERIVFTIGLVCGQMKSKNYTKYIAAIAGNNDLKKVQSVYYRGKSPEKPASNYYFQSTDEHGSQHKIFWNEGVSEAWINRWFTPNACNYCDDVFAELADVTFMDAWLPEYSKDSMGTNLVLVRSPEILVFIQEEIGKKEINVSKIPIEKVIKSQMGVLDLKRNQLSYRLYIALQEGQKVPEKRVHPKEKIGVLKKREIKLKARMQKESKELFLDYYKDTTLDIKTFRDGMQPYIKQTKQLRSVGKLALPIQIIKKISRREGNRR
ncbi:Coenzyme F420 hydrogenase/dehydrogenase, beta subunit C-terminal domain [Methanosarcina mazei]|uniref:4Fe-4S ferredoxin n=1 Tax=Methanosarcina mazei TaxID=2209 RepID=A0A0F8KT55_METMZ|nr:Coenzyme F420 hydrogenase/dehydrogenase, beta subunit C-terminal domain [Methanosarcina mazei]KKH16917.1 4Fe-4S ferredoxin [Methanosarcina mazei]KKH18722.1 4Fe-4S ferredoxin [Methanosarcina mazei]KKH20823.1 4Fe-4S ferredoxin [Methanosarcina mazei]